MKLIDRFGTVLGQGAFLLNPTTNKNLLTDFAVVVGPDQNRDSPKGTVAKRVRALKIDKNGFCRVVFYPITLVKHGNELAAQINSVVYKEVPDEISKKIWMAILNRAGKSRNGYK